MKTKKEFSAGGVVYKKLKINPPTGGEKLIIKFLLGKHSGYHKWVLPKGLIEKGEKPEETAIRETQEEMGIIAKIIDFNPIGVEKYSYTADFKNSAILSPEDSEGTRRVLAYQEAGGKSIKVDKTVTFYLMEYVSGDPSDYGWEMEECGWFDFNEAWEMLGFEGEKRTLSRANKILISKS